MWKYIIKEFCLFCYCFFIQMVFFFFVVFAGEYETYGDLFNLESDLGSLNAEGQRVLRVNTGSK